MLILSIYYLLIHFVILFHVYFIISQIFHTIAIILLIVSTSILLIGITVRMINDRYMFQYEVPFIVSMFVASVSNFEYLFSIEK